MVLTQTSYSLKPLFRGPKDTLAPLCELGCGGTGAGEKRLPCRMRSPTMVKDVTSEPGTGCSEWGMLASRIFCLPTLLLLRPSEVQQAFRLLGVLCSWTADPPEVALGTRKALSSQHLV